MLRQKIFKNIDLICDLNDKSSRTVPVKLNSYAENKL